MGEGVTGQYGRAHWKLLPHFALFRMETKKLFLHRATKENWEKGGCQHYIRFWLELDTDVRIILCIETVTTGTHDGEA